MLSKLAKFNFSEIVEKIGQIFKSSAIFMKIFLKSIKNRLNYFGEKLDIFLKNIG